MLLSKAFPPGTTFLAFTTPNQIILNQIVLGIICLAIPGNILLLFLSTLPDIVSSALLLYSRSFADLLFLLNNAVLLSANIANGGMAFGVFGCKINYFLNMFAHSSSILMMTSVAMERHLTVCYGYAFTRRKILGVILFVHGVSILYGIGTLLLPDAAEGIEIIEDVFVCTPAWYNTSIPNSRIIILPITLLVICLCYIIFAYASVYLHFRNSFELRKTRILDATNLDENALNAVKEKEMTIFKICIFNSIPFVMTLIPFGVAVIHQFATKTPFRPPWYMIIVTCMLIDPILNPYIQITFDNRIKATIKGTRLYMIAQNIWDRFQREQDSSLDGQNTWFSAETRSPFENSAVPCNSMVDESKKTIP